MRIVFMGTPIFAIPSLEMLSKTNHEILAVISQPDREKDKKGNLLNTPIKQKAIELNLKHYQFEKVSVDGFDLLDELKPDLIVTVAFGQLLSSKVLNIPNNGVYNVHASLLPKYRGSSPIQSALLNGEKETGVAIMKTELSMDTGDILNMSNMAIELVDNCFTLQEKLSILGANLLIETLQNLENGILNPIKQDDSKATYCKKIVKNDSLINWCDSNEDIFNKIRAFYSWPTAYALHNGKNIKIYESEIIAEKDFIDMTNKSYVMSDICCISNGSICVLGGKKLLVKCGKGFLMITKLQAPGKKILTADEFLRGYIILAKDMFSS